MGASETEIRPNWFVAVRVWWAFVWRDLALSMIAGSLFTYLLETYGRQDEGIANLIFVGSGFVFIGIQVFVFRHIISSRYGNFRVAILKQEPLAQSDHPV